MRMRALWLVALIGCGGSLDDGAEDDLAAASPQVVAYSQDGWNELADAFHADAAQGGAYFMHIPAGANDKTIPRGPAEPQRMRARGFHALAEFHFGAWSQEPGSWYARGVEFRRRMIAQGYDVSAGDSWAINELPSTTRKSAEFRRGVSELVRGLYDGPPGAPHVKGAVFVIGVGSTMTNFSEYKPNLEAWLTDDAFWKSMSAHVRFWGQETYGDPRTACVAGSTVAQRSNAIDAFTQHVTNLADAGPASAAKAFFAKAYVPLISAAWRADGYQTTDLSLDQMKHFVSNQIYASRAQRNGARVGLGWTFPRDRATEAEVVELAQRTASAVRHAYENGGAAAGACSPSHAYTWCQCAVAGAAFNPAWRALTSW